MATCLIHSPLLFVMFLPFLLIVPLVRIISKLTIPPFVDQLEFYKVIRV